MYNDLVIGMLLLMYIPNMVGFGARLSDLAIKIDKYINCILFFMQSMKHLTSSYACDLQKKQKKKEIQNRK